MMIGKRCVGNPWSCRDQVERMILEAALPLILILLMTIPIVKAYEWLQDFLYGPYINRGK